MTPPPALPRELVLPEQRQLVEALRHALPGAAPGQAAELIETHISLVLVGGEHAYKIKKAVQPGFLDYSTLALRHHWCDEELRLNRRLAAALYLGVEPITGTPAAPAFGGDGPVIDYAVKMRAFDQHGLWDRMARRGALRGAHVDALVAVLCPFYEAAAVAAPGGRLGTPAQVRAQLVDSLDAIEPGLADTADRHVLRGLRRWEQQTFTALEPVFAERLALGRVRECHGDLHLGNVTQIDGRVTVFDGIEFNDDFRWIDVASELAFMAMDLHAHGLPALAHRLVNGYFEHGGDYAGAHVLRYYLVHRALVRAKVAQLRAAQAGADRAAATADLRRHLALAAHFSAPVAPALMLTHGFSGSGKTSGTQALLEAQGAVRIRSDVERKRLAGLGALARSHSAPGGGLYGADTTAATYARLETLAVPVLRGGFSVILDATYLRRAQRDSARRLAAAQGVPLSILHFDAAPGLLRERLRQRAAAASDASEAGTAVLELQIRTAEPLQDDETFEVARPPAAGGP